MKKIANLIFVVFFCFNLCGCWPLILGAGALGGYMISKDTIQGETDKDLGSIWASAIKVSDVMGIIRAEDKSKGTLAVEIDRNNVNIKIEQLTKATVRIRVSARSKFLAPNIALAEKIYTKIIQQTSR